MRAMTVFVAAYLISASLLAAEPVARSARDCPVAGQEERSSLPVLARDLRSKNAFLPSAIGFDSDGLRGLQTSGQTKGNIICRVPRGSIIVANGHAKEMNKRPIDALSATLLEEVRLGQQSGHIAYIQSLPEPNDPSLTNIGGVWDDEQLEWLCHPPAAEKFRKLRSLRDAFIERNDNQDDNNEDDRCRPGWAYDLSSSRALEGPFGRNGAVRSTLLGTLASFLAAFSPLLYLQDLSKMPFEPSIPLILSVVALVSTLTSDEVELGMLPWIDVANHKSTSSLHLGYDLLRDGIVLKGGAGSGNVEFDYGGRNGICNDKLLGEFGFVEVDNPNDILEVAVAGDIVVNFGRYGVVNKSAAEISDDEILESARKARCALVAGFSSQTSVPTDPIAVGRFKMASQWRNEKIRLLDEYIHLHS